MSSWWEAKIEDLLDAEQRLSAEELGFVDDCGFKLAEDEALTEHEAARLEQLWEQYVGGGDG